VALKSYMNTAVLNKLVSISTDEFAGTTFDFMLSNLPYGKSWASEQQSIKDGKAVIDSRFGIKLKSYRDEEEDADAIEEVTADFFALENERDGLFREILNFA